MARDLGVKVTENGKYYFISYNNEDSNLVSHYLKNMDLKGLPVWYDYGIDVGDHWEEIIASKIDNSEAVIMFLSREIFNKKESFVHKEWKMAKEFFDKKIYTVMLDDIDKKEVPHRYVSWWIDIISKQYIVTTRYNVDTCIDMILDAVGYKSIELQKSIINELDNDVKDTTKKINNPNQNKTLHTENTINDSFEIKFGVLTKYRGKESVVIIPDGVTSIGKCAFRDCTFVSSITIPDSVTRIGEVAFNDCTSLTSITIPDSVKSIGKWAFYGCRLLEAVTLGVGITKIGDYTFADCKKLKFLQFCGSEAEWNQINKGVNCIPSGCEILFNK